MGCVSSLFLSLSVGVVTPSDSYDEESEGESGDDAKTSDVGSDLDGAVPIYLPQKGVSMPRDRTNSLTPI